MSNNGGSNAFEATLSFLVGAATGFVLGILFAPASGAETRKKLQDEVTKTGEKAREGYDKITHEAEKGIQVVKEKTQESIDTIKEFVDKKKEELLSKNQEEFPKKAEDTKK